MYKEVLPCKRLETAILSNKGLAGNGSSDTHTTSKFYMLRKTTRSYPIL